MGIVMTVRKSFSTVFKEELKQRGFLRKGPYFLRMRGEFVQGVMLRPIVPYIIQFFSVPFWHMQFQIERLKLTSTIWGEGQGWEIMAPMYAQFDPSEDEKGICVMQACLSLAKEHIFPLLDRCADYDTFMKYAGNVCWETLPQDPQQKYIEVSVESVEEYAPPVMPSPYPGAVVYRDCFRLGWFDSDQLTQEYVAMYQSYLNGSYEWAKDWMRNSKFLQANLARWQFTFEQEYRILSYAIQNTKLDWIIGFRQKQAEHILPRLEQELGLDISHIQI